MGKTRKSDHRAQSGVRLGNPHLQKRTERICRLRKGVKRSFSYIIRKIRLSSIELLHLNNYLLLFISRVMKSL